MKIGIKKNHKKTPISSNILSLKSVSIGDDLARDITEQKPKPINLRAKVSLWSRVGRLWQ